MNCWLPVPCSGDWFSARLSLYCSDDAGREAHEIPAAPFEIEFYSVLSKAVDAVCCISLLRLGSVVGTAVDDCWVWEAWGS